jgi:cytochrome d ubiquinol oxidase subunit II
MTVFAIVCVYTPFMYEYVKARWFDNLSIIWVLSVLALHCAFVVFNNVRKRKNGMPFVATMGIFLFSYLGLLVSK